MPPCSSELLQYPSFNHFIIFTGKGTEFEKRQVLEDYKQSTTMLKLRNQMLEDYDIDLFESESQIAVPLFFNPFHSLTFPSFLSFEKTLYLPLSTCARGFRSALERRSLS
mmetsp:Transcript_8287/g.15339  ORF Transcript_8287/g.15339 Transcript_8287/m.15339 type:complete len:110 (-) Transcript_8287:129-458(-)